MSEPKKTPMTVRRYLAMVMAVVITLWLLTGCRSRRVVTSTTAVAHTATTHAVSDTLQITGAAIVTTTDTASSAVAEVTIETDSFVLTWDTLGSHVVPSSIVRNRMTTRLMDVRSTSKNIETLLSEMEEKGIKTVIATAEDSVSVVSEETAEKPAAEKPKEISRTLQWLNYLLLVICLAAVQLLLLTLVYRIIKRAFHDG